MVRRAEKRTPEVRVPHLHLEGVAQLLDTLGGPRNKVVAYVLRNMDENYEVHRCNTTIAEACSTEPTTTSKVLNRLARAGFLKKLARSTWEVQKKLLVVYGAENLTFRNK